MSLKSRSVRQLEDRLVKLQNQIGKIQMSRLEQGKQIWMLRNDPDYEKGSKIVREFNRTRQLINEKRSNPTAHPSLPSLLKNKYNKMRK